MATKINNEYSTQSEAELLGSIKTMESDLLKMKFDHAVKGLSNPLEIRFLRREIARIHTELRSREVNGMTSEQLESRTKLRARRRKSK
jgi:large subunit ribosomal protein L29